MPNTTPAIDTATTFDFVRLRALETASCHVHIVAAATENRKGESLAAMHDMARAGAVAFSDDGDGIASANVMRSVLQTCRTLGRAFMQHCQDPTLTIGASMHDGPVSASLGLVGWPRVAEETMLERDLRLNLDIGCSYHAQHLSSGGSVEILRAARAAGVVATGEVSPHHLLLTDDACEGWNTSAKMNPPLREAADRQALREGVAEGVITVLATDHAPHTTVEKAVPFEEAPCGVVGLETALPLYAEALIQSGAIEWPRLIALLTIEPARLCRLAERGVGTLQVGGPADVTVIDPTAQWTIDPAAFKSKSANTPFLGRGVMGRAEMTIIAGELRHTTLDRSSPIEPVQS
jgi:dihydroorotase